MKYTILLTVATALISAGSVDAYESLKSRAGNFRIGIAADSSKFNNQNYVNAMKNFNYMVAENACKMSYIQPQRGRYNFSPCDTHYNKAKELGMDFRGHTLVWHSMPPSWFQNLRGNDLKNAMIDHITKTLQHYQNKIDTWDVVNEAIDDSSSGTNWRYRNSFLYQNAPDFLEVAFKTARQVAPNVKLFYNDYNTEGIYGKSEAVYNFVKAMKNKGIPIDGVGLQYHVSISAYPQYNKINSLISRYCQLGVQVHITEMDVVSNGNANAQATVYAEALKACLNNSCCKAFLVWGVGDNDSWLGAGKTGLLFNGSYQPKAAYNSLLTTLGNRGGSTNNNNNNNNNQNNNKNSNSQSKNNNNNNNNNQNKNNNNNNNNNNQNRNNNNNNNNQNKNNNNNNNGNCAGLWAQCGGIGFNGPKCCKQGSCKFVNNYYSQCLY